MEGLATPTWRKSSFVIGNGECVEVAGLTGAIRVSDCKDAEGRYSVSHRRNGTLSLVASSVMTSTDSGTGLISLKGGGGPLSDT